jgi:predicted ribosomally synthesized peptide with SipW-like signal peptide
MSRTKTKRYLMLLAAVGLVAAGLGGTGTFASFNAEVTNGGNTFQTGSITLTDQVNTGGVCYSSAGTNNVNSTGCDAIFAAQAWQPGDTPTSEHLTLSNTGTLTPSALTVWAPAVATDGTPDNAGLVCNYRHYTPGSDTNAFSGTGNPCTALQIQIQEYTTSGFSVTTGKCVFPVDASHACGTQYTSLSALPSEASKLTVTGGLDAGTTRYFTIKVKYPATAGAADNAYQAQQTFFDLTWHIE